MPTTARLALAAGLVALLAVGPACRKPRAPTPLTASKWTGTMTYRGQPYAFQLTIDAVEPDGDFTGEIAWDAYGVQSRIRGQADGNHLVFVDSDRDVKDVTLAGAAMAGTDKNGAATFVAHRVDGRDRAPAQALPRPPPAPAVGREWARQWAVCEGLSRSTRSTEVAPRCWQELAAASADAAPCARLDEGAAACRRRVAGLRGDFGKCEGDADCIAEAALHGAGEAVCQTLRSSAALRRCLAGARRQPTLCLDGTLAAADQERCVAHLARATGDPKICRTLESPDECLAALPLVPSNASDDCMRFGSPAGMYVCLLQAVGNGEPPGRCPNIEDTALREACEKAGALPAGGRLPILAE